MSGQPLKASIAAGLVSLCRDARNSRFVTDQKTRTTIRLNSVPRPAVDRSLGICLHGERLLRLQHVGAGQMRYTPS
jgi:hypothetical protein